jgi:GDP-mannose 6-dehydrogenase
MNITVVGLGYVGAVSAVCLASRGHKVWGVDISAVKVDLLNRGQSPIVEPGLQEKVSVALRLGNLRAVSNIEEALCETDLCFIAVATPSQKNGQIDSSHLMRACQQIADVLKRLRKRQIIVIRSSVLPNVFDDANTLFAREARGLATLCANPEFLREGTAISDFDNPPLTIIGTNNVHAESMLRELYSDLNAPIHVLPAKEATMVKYASNAYHALKVAFANEVGALCHEAGLDSSVVMQTFCKDTTLNISAHYLRPGFAFGGSCLPKDIRALLYAGKMFDVDLPLMRGLLESNAGVIGRAVEIVLDARVRRVGLVGLSFKKDTDDLRESPFVELAERLIGKGIELRIYDPNVALARLVGANKEYIERTIPHLYRQLVGSLSELAESSELVVIGHNVDGIEAIRDHGNRYHLLDLTGQARFLRTESKMGVAAGAI